MNPAENDVLPQPRRVLRALPAHLGAVMTAYATRPALQARGAVDLPAMIAGIQKYQAHPFRRAMPALEEVWRRGEARLLLCPAGRRRRGAICLVPSMINRSAILDLLPDRSFTRWLAAAGYDVFLLDWGDPARDSGLADFSGVIEGALLPALAFAAGNGPVAGIGYCMGGTLLAAAACLQPESLAKAIFLASPWDFAAGDRRLADTIRAGTPQALQMIAARGSLPADWIQSAFAGVNADRTARKFADFAALAGGAQEDLFVAVEDWLNDGIDFPGGVAAETIRGWYGENKPGQGRWAIAGRVLDPGKLDLPALVISSTTDRLVPYESARMLADIVPRASLLSPAIGHIGMMSGRAAVESVWQPVLDWLG